MIVIHATVTTTPGTADALRSAIAEMEQASRAEPGCIEYVFTSALNDPANLRIFEQWRDVDALKAHFATSHMQAFNAAMQKHPPKNVAVKMFEATELPFPPQ
jgi:quinol monooxygenase YgiN